jgi:enoyl-CoA hydratase/carnithine racemase
LLGHRFTAEEGLTLGIVNEVCPSETLVKRALAVAGELLAIPFTALKHTKCQIDRSFDQDFATLMAEMVDAEEDCLRSPEHNAVMAAYLEELARRGKSQGEEQI